MSNQRRKDGWLWDFLCWSLLTVLGFWVIWRYAAGTTPLRPHDYQWDSALFQVIGKLWADGLTPYVDIFDHKGPLLFLVQKLAYETAAPRVALYVMESLMVSVSLGLGYQTLRLQMRRAWALAGAALMLVFWLPLMEYGNLCETHSMPWIMLALYFQMRYLSSGKKKHPVGAAFLYGLCFGANVMIRPNNGVLIAMIALMLTIELAVRKQWKNILANALALIAGLLVAILPFVLYFHMKGAMDAFIYATWTFNLIYAQSLEFLLDFQSLRNVLFFITPACLCMFLCVLCCLRKRWTLAGMHLLASVATLYVTLGGIGYSHYFMLHVPLIALALYTAALLAQEGRGWKLLMLVSCMGLALLSIRTTLPYAASHFLQAPTAQEAAQETAYDDMVRAICERIPQQERDQIAVCGLLVTDAELFIKSDLHPVGRYCFLMEWHSRADSSIRSRFMDTLRSGEAKWLIYREGGAGEEILDIIDACYTLEATYTWQDTDYLLYRWK